MNQSSCLAIITISSHATYSYVALTSFWLTSDLQGLSPCRTTPRHDGRTRLSSMAHQNAETPNHSNPDLLGDPWIYGLWVVFIPNCLRMLKEGPRMSQHSDRSELRRLSMAQRVAFMMARNSASTSPDSSMTSLQIAHPNHFISFQNLCGGHYQRIQSTDQRPRR